MATQTTVHRSLGDGVAAVAAGDLIEGLDRWLLRVESARLGDQVAACPSARSRA